MQIYAFGESRDLMFPMIRYLIWREILRFL